MVRPRAAAGAAARGAGSAARWAAAAAAARRRAAGAPNRTAAVRCQQRRLYYQQPHGYQQPPSYQYYGYKQQQQQQQQQPAETLGSWQRPLVVQYKSRWTVWDWMRIGFIIWVLWQWSAMLDYLGDDSPGSEGDDSSRGKRSDQGGSESGGGGLLGGILAESSDPVKPVDLGSPNHDVHWADVHGCDEAKEELKEVVAFLKESDRFTQLGGKLPKGFLLVGPPGTGKTMLAKAIAREADVPFFYASGAQFEEMYVGVGARRVRELFEAARKHKPCLVFIDEIDAVGGKRSKLDASHDRATINQLLAEMDGFHSSDSVIVVAATNSPKTLDKALTRPGRFDRQISVDPPDMRGRARIMEHYLKKVTAAPEVDPQVIARGTNGMVGADLANIVNLAALQATKAGADMVRQEHLEEAKDRVLMGMEQKSKRIPDDERKNTAYHEAGHALVAMFTDKSSVLHKATIRPRGQALGLTMQLPPDDQISQSLQEMHARLRVLMGGRIAEELIFGRDAVTSGASNDIQKATALARDMVRKYGLSAAMGCVDYSFADDPEGVYLSNKTRRRIEEEVRNILDKAYREATQIITEREKALHSIAQGLLEKDTLTGTEMRQLAGVPEKEAQPGTS